MFNRTHIYTVHENSNKPDPADRTELVREGFSWGAFLFSALWLLWHRLWLPALAYLLVVAVITRLGLSPAVLGVVQLGIQFALGCHANDIKRWVLENRGYVLRGVVCAESPMMAQRRVLEAQCT